jgi:hypothetical protein
LRWWDCSWFEVSVRCGLVDEGALVEELDYGDPSREQPPQPISYTFTSAALLMLGEKEEGWQP